MVKIYVYWMCHSKKSLPQHFEISQLHKASMMMKSKRKFWVLGNGQRIRSAGCGK